MDIKLATEQFKALAKHLQQGQQCGEGSDLILEVAAQAMQSDGFDSTGLPSAFRKAVGDALDCNIDINCIGCLHTLRLDYGGDAEETLAQLNAEQIEAARLERIEEVNADERLSEIGRIHGIARINKAVEAVTKQYPAAFAALKVLQEQGWLSDPGADLAKEHEAEPQAIAA